MDRDNKPKFTELPRTEQAKYIMEARTPSPEEVIYEPRVEFLDAENVLTREERGRVIAMGDRTAISYRNLSEKVIGDRSTPGIEIEGETESSTSSFYLMYSLAARSSKEVSHTSIMEQVGVGPTEYSGDAPIVMEGLTILAGLRDVCAERHAGFEAFSSRGGIFPDRYWRIPEVLANSKVGAELEAVNRENYQAYLYLTEKGLEHYLESSPRRKDEKLWQWQWRVLNLALDDSRQITNGTMLNHLAMHPNSALSLRETVVRLSSSELPETAEIADRLRDLGKSGLPTLMRYTDSSAFTKSLPLTRQQIINDLSLNVLPNERGVEGLSGFLNATVTPDASRVFLSAFLARESGMSYQHVFEQMQNVDEERVGDSINKIFDGITLHDKPPSELEMIQIVSNHKMSIGAIYETIRHRLSTHLVSGFSPDHGYTIPGIYKEIGLEDIYRQAIANSEYQYDLVSELGSEYKRILAPYFVTRAHLQPVTVRMSGLDVFHFTKLRAHEAAHPDIGRPALGFEEFMRQTEPLVFGHIIKK